MDRRALLVASGAALGGLAGCTGGSGQAATTETTATATTTTTETTTKAPDYPIHVDLSDVDIDLKGKYEANIPSVSDHHSKTASLDINGLLEKHSGDRQAQVENLIVNVANQYTDGTTAGTAALQALEEELDWFTFDNDARVNTETAYEMGTGAMSLVNFSDENGEEHFLGFARKDGKDATIDHNIVRNIPDSEYMDGDGGIALAWDIQSNATNIKNADNPPSEYVTEGWHLGLQSILWSNDGPVDRERPGEDSHLLFNKDSLEFIDAAYSDSAQAARKATDRVNELYLKADQKYDLSSDYIELGVENDELVAKSVLNESQAQDVIHDYSRFEI
ncbi:MAG: hypothetical protein ABEJ59_06440 [Halanaeroarchaeum sp.]